MQNLKTLFIALLSVTSVIGTGYANQPDPKAQMTVKLWIDTCASHFTAPEKVKEIAKKNHFHKNPPYSKALLSGKKGTVWDVSAGSLIQIALILYDDGTCQIRTKKADGEQVREAFEKVLNGIKTPGVIVKKVIDKPVNKNKISLHQLVYFVGAEASKHGWAFRLVFSKSEKIAYQVILTIGLGKRPSGV